MPGGGTVTNQYPLDRRYVGYLLRDTEMFARSYAQYIATKSQDVAMLAELDEIRTPRSAQFSYPTQWQNDDFEPIAQAFDEMFKELEWLK